MNPRTNLRTNRDLVLEIQANAVLAALEKQGMSQSQLAAACGVPLYTINRIVHRKTLAKKEVAESIAKALNIDTKALFGGEHVGALDEWAEGVHEEPLEDGTVRIRVNARVEPGVEMAIKALVNHQAPISTVRLWMLLDALYAPLRKPGAE
jgi:transcriptional regulator with XRE-family HTH domain